jgi:hypothetical protein
MIKLETKKYTKEEIETGRKLFFEWDTAMNFEDWLDSLLKPKTKKIRVEIELDENVGTVENLLNALGVLNVISVKELPEVFSREEVIELIEIGFATHKYNKQCLSERKSK